MARERKMLFCSYCKLTSLVLGVVLLGICIQLAGCQSDEPASFKYSKQANEPNYQHGHGHSHSHGHSHHRAHGHSHSHLHHPPQSHQPQHSQPKSMSKMPVGSKAALWLEALGSTVLISAAPFFVLFFIPLDNRSEHESLLKVLLSFASGGLLGDAFLHLIPHALLAQSQDTVSLAHDGENVDHEFRGHDMSVGLWVLTGIMAFLIIEKFVRMVKGDHEHSHVLPVEISASNPGDGMTKQRDPVASPDAGGESGAATMAEETRAGVSSQPDMESELPDTTDGLRHRKVSTTEEEPVPNSEHEHSEEVKEDIKVAGYLNLAADFTHNFTDGLAIGASYLAGRSVGIVTTVTILLHEVPHEIGDFAILIQSGCSKRKAIYLQLVTAVGALAGTLFGLVVEDMGESAGSWILPFTAGGFIYVATVSVIPELLEDTKFWQSVKEVIALLIGVLLMVLIAQYE